MTSTPFNVGYDGIKKSSRVLKPPGGGHTDIFGQSAEPANACNRRPPSATASSIVIGEQNEAPQAPAPLREPPVEPEMPPPEKPNAVDRDGGQNVKEEEKRPNSEVPHITTPIPPAEKRVRVPPGGFSSKLW